MRSAAPRRRADRSGRRVVRDAGRARVSAALSGRGATQRASTAWSRPTWSFRRASRLDAQTALDAVLDRMRAEPACARAYPNLRADSRACCARCRGRSPPPADRRVEPFGLAATCCSARCAGPLRAGARRRAAGRDRRRGARRLQALVGIGRRFLAAREAAGDRHAPLRRLRRRPAAARRDDRPARRRFRRRLRPSLRAGLRGVAARRGAGGFYDMAAPVRRCFS